MQQTIEATLTIATPEILSAHPELHHYTNYGGLEGITQNNTLWATHFTELNDASEITLLKEPLKAAITAHFREILRTRQRERLSIKRQVEKFGGLFKASEFVAHDFVNIMYKSTFHDATSTVYAEPFVASFCSHAADHAYETDNGLLSQWRGYGNDGGYCIVFDTAALARLLKQESDA